MIVKEFYEQREDGVKLYRTYSDAGFMIQKVGTDEIYSEAIDVETATYEYIETEQKIEDIEVEEIDETAEENTEGA